MMFNIKNLYQKSAACASQACMRKQRSLDNKDSITYNDSLEQALKDQEAINKYLKTIQDEEE